MLWLTALIAFAASFAGKLLADVFLMNRVPLLGSFAGLRLSFNPGIAFSISFPSSLQLPLILLAFLLILFVGHKAESAYGKVGFGLIIGGALGNIVDRIPDGLVTDYVQVGTFPIFNLADSCITVGVVVLLLEMLMEWRRRMRKE